MFWSCMSGVIDCWFKVKFISFFSLVWVLSCGLRCYWLIFSKIEMFVVFNLSSHWNVSCSTFYCSKLYRLFFLNKICLWKTTRFVYENQFFIYFHSCQSSCYNCTGWLGIKHQVTYLHSCQVVHCMALLELVWAFQNSKNQHNCFEEKAFCCFFTNCTVLTHKCGVLPS